jgi:hypothetical protein
VAIKTERNITQTEGENKKSKSLHVELKRTGNMKCVAITVITGATGRVAKVLKKNLEAITGKHRFSTTCRYWNITHSAGSTSVRTLKPERWGSLLDQEKK